jgi:adenosylhomocysteine nucleosidase
LKKSLVPSAVLAFVSLVTFASSAQPVDTTPRTAVISAFDPEWQNLQAALKNRADHIIDGTDFETGEIEGKPVVLFLSGVSMVNAAMTTQRALDHFTIRQIVFSGIAGGADPALHLGDVVVPDQWREYLESVFPRDVAGKYELPGFLHPTGENNFGMIFPQPVEVARAPQPPEQRTWFPVDPKLLTIARKVAEAQRLEACTAEKKCLAHSPRIVVGGNGVSGSAFVDNTAFREYVRRVYKAEALDMESAAVGHVAYANKIPYIVFRSLSDLAGGGSGQNEMTAFQGVASSNSASVVKAFLREQP